MPPSDKIKKCAKCNEFKTLEEFSDQKKGRFGKKSYCKICDREYNKINYEDKRANRITQIQLWQSQNQNKYKQYQRKYHKS